MRLFFSWQDDINGNKNLIRKILNSLQRSIQDLEIDEATRNVPGSPDIAQTILNKIDQADIFVCDMTIINKGARKYRRTPNPNVLYELGYARAVLGKDNIVTIADEDRGGDKDMPFDVRNNRMALKSFSDRDAEDYIKNTIAAAIENYEYRSKDTYPKLKLTSPEVKWAGNYSGFGAAFLAKFEIDNLGGAADYVSNVLIIGSDESGKRLESNSFMIRDLSIDEPFRIEATHVVRKEVFIGLDHTNHRPDSGFQSGKVDMVFKFKSGAESVVQISI